MDRLAIVPAASDSNRERSTLFVYSDRPHEFRSSFNVHALTSLSDLWDRHFDQRYRHLLFFFEHPPTPEYLAILGSRPNVGCLLREGLPYPDDPAALRLWLGSFPAGTREFSSIIDSARRLLDKQVLFHRDLIDQRRRIDNLSRIHRIGALLSQERSMSTLFETILGGAREVTSAEAGSLFLIEETELGREMIFAHTQNDRIPIRFREHRFPLNRNSIAGYVADTGEVLNIDDVYGIPVEAPYRFNDQFDRESNFRTGSMLTVPIRTVYGETVGVLQLINKRREGAAEVVSFDGEDVRVLESLSGLAASALLNSRLVEEIRALLDGFIQASVTAIDSRDPATKGHSMRVTAMTLALAEAVSEATEPPFHTIRFSEEQLRELRYATLLHDFGKIGIPERVLTKAKKLYPEELSILLSRLNYIRVARKLKVLTASVSVGPETERALDGIDHEMDDVMAIISRSNEPTVLSEGDFVEVTALLARDFVNDRGERFPYLTPHEADSLSIRKGSITPTERQQIEDHVIHSVRFLKHIPWSKSLSRIPEIVWGHHERPDRKGYPRKLSGSEIPVESKMMAIADIFDALTAQDRPYKKSVPVDRALSILKQEAETGGIDPELFELFLKRRIYERQ